MAYNPATGHLLVVSRTPVNAVYILDAATGAELGTLNVDASIIKDGTFVINHIGVNEDIPGNVGRTSNRIARI